MYVIIAGKHPLIGKGDLKASYSKKLMDPKWNFPSQFSPLAQSLFLQFVKTNPLDRYSAKEALTHPWITRYPGPIPLSYADSLNYEHAKEKLQTVKYIIDYGR